MNDWDYRPNGKPAQMARVILTSKDWNPTKPGMLRFDAKITKCDHPARAKICGRSLRQPKPWLVGAWDTFRVKGDVTLEMIGMFDPRFDLPTVALAEGLSITLLEPAP
jgi:hypothetical protein